MGNAADMARVVDHGEMLKQDAETRLC